jgi:acetoin utilization deacetylase AcuC-like enzyme
VQTGCIGIMGITMVVRKRCLTAGDRPTKLVRRPALPGATVPRRRLQPTTGSFCFLRRGSKAEPCVSAVEEAKAVSDARKVERFRLGRQFAGARLEETRQASPGTVVPKLLHCELPSDLPEEQSTEAGKSRWLVDSLQRNRTRASRRIKIEGVRLNPTGPLLDECLAGVHSRGYIAAVWGAGQSDCEVPLPSRRFLEGAGSLWALYMAADVVGSARAGGSSSRIVGSLGGNVHHARKSSSDEGMPFNSLAAVASLITTHDVVVASTPVSGVLIIDADGDCGGGTAELIAGNPHVQQVDIAVDDYDAYSDTSNASLYVVSQARDYLPTFEQALEAVKIVPGSEPICLYSAGVNGYEKASRGLPGITAEILRERDRLVFNWCRRVGVRVAYTLGSGSLSDNVTSETLVALHRQTVEAAAVAASKNEDG